MYIECTFFGRLHFGLRGCCPSKFLHALEIDQGLIAHTTTPKINRENLKFGLKCSVWALITSGLVRIFSPNFSRPRDELWSTYWPTRSASYTVIWHMSIRHVFLFGVVRTTSRHTGVPSSISCSGRRELTALLHWSLHRPLRRPIAAALYLVFFGLIRQLPLLREEFRLSKFTLHSDLRRRAASRLALPCPSSDCY